ncbi:MAG: thioredoxin [Bacteroidetes bacterium HGW-Bacteroidetes-4]|jgi:thioredoxin 1|nr:MAG: thioredoxin [Bacteroidetes bacterium HGW-Bacteroidetes-4]
MAKEFHTLNFDNEVLQSNQLVVVDFWAAWCGPCKYVGPIIDELSNEYAGKVSIGKVDVDKFPRIAEKYNIMNIPTILFFKNGQIIDKIKGAAPKKDFVQLLEKHIK